jgi:hypothetical protein
MKFIFSNKLITKLLSLTLAITFTACSTQNITTNFETFSHLHSTMKFQHPSHWSFDDSSDDEIANVILSDPSFRTNVSFSSISNVNSAYIEVLENVFALHRQTSELYPHMSIVDEPTKLINGIEFQNSSYEIFEDDFFSSTSLSYYLDEATNILYTIRIDSKDFITESLSDEELADIMENSEQFTPNRIKLTSEEQEINDIARVDAKKIIDSFSFGE